VKPWILTREGSANWVPTTFSSLSVSGRMLITLFDPSVTVPVLRGRKGAPCEGLVASNWVLPTASKLASRSTRPLRVTEVVLVMTLAWFTLRPAIVALPRGISMIPRVGGIPGSIHGRPDEGVQSPQSGIAAGVGGEADLLAGRENGLPIRR